MSGVAVRSHAGPRVIGVGMALVAVAYIGYNADRPHPQVAAPLRPPSVAPSASPEKPKPTKTTRPGGTKSKPRHAAGDVRVVAASAPRTHTGGGGTTSRRPSTIAPSGPKPRPPAASPPVTTSCDIGLSALVLNACLNLGAR